MDPISSFDYKVPTTPQQSIPTDDKGQQQTNKYRHNLKYYKDSQAPYPTEQKKFNEKFKATPLPESQEVIDILGEDPLLVQYLKEFVEIASDDSYKDDFREVMLWIYQEMIRLQDEQAEITTSSLNLSRIEKKQISTQRLKKMEEVLEKAKKCKNWGKLEALLTGVQVTASLVGTAAAVGGTIVAGSTGVLEIAAIACVVGGTCLYLGNTLDHLLGDPLKKGITKIFGCEQEDKQEKWADRIGMGAGILSLILSLPGTFVSISNTGANAVKTAFSYLGGAATASQGTTKAVTAHEKYQKDKKDAELMTLTFAMEHHGDQMRDHLNSLEKLLEDLQHIRKQTRQFLSAEQFTNTNLFME